MDEELAIAQGFRISDIELNDAKKKLETASERLKKLQDERSGALAKKKELDDAREKTLTTEAKIAQIEEELARLKNDDTQIPAQSSNAAPKKNSPAAPPSSAATAKPGL